VVVSASNKCRKDAASPRLNTNRPTSFLLARIPYYRIPNLPLLVGFAESDMVEKKCALKQLGETLAAEADPRGGDRPPKTYESNFFSPHFVQFGKQHSQFKAILSSIVLSQQCCEV